MNDTVSSSKITTKSTQDFDRLQKEFNDLSNGFVVNEDKIDVSASTIKQIKLDVDRSYNFIKDNHDKDLYKKLLKTTLLSVFELKPEWFYYQGYHDIVAFLLFQFTYIESGTIQYKTGSKDRLLTYIIAFSEHFLKDFLTKDLKNAMIYLKFIPKIMKKYNAYSYHIFKDNPFYGSIANIITLFTHTLSLESMNIRVKIITYLLESKNISFILVFYAKLVSHYKTQIEKNILNNTDIGNDPLILQSLINTLITTELDNFELSDLDNLLKECLTDIKSSKIQNIFKYSFENRGLLINFDYTTEKNILKNTLLVAVNMIVLKKIKPDVTSPYTFAGTVLTINNIQRFMRYYAHKKLK